MNGEPRRASRRDLFRLLGESLAELASETRPAEAMREAARAFGGAAGDGGRAPYPTAVSTVPSTLVPVERERLIVDLAVHPVPLARGRRFRGDGRSEIVLVVRVSPDHFAAVDADCPHCGGALSFDVPEDAVLCPVGQAAYRMDGNPLRGPVNLRLKSHPCRLAGPRLEVG